MFVVLFHRYKNLQKAFQNIYNVLRSQNSNMYIRQGRYKQIAKQNSINMYLYVIQFSSTASELDIYLCKILLSTSVVVENYPQFRANFLIWIKKLITQYFNVILCDQKSVIRVFGGKKVQIDLFSSAHRFSLLPYLHTFFLAVLKKSTLSFKIAKVISV